MNTPGEILSLFVWLMMAGATVAVVAGVIRRRRAAGSAERQQAMAVVEAMERRVQPHHQSHFVQKEHYATFRLEDGSALRFLISEAEYTRLQQGDTGELTWQGTRFLFFSRR